MAKRARQAALVTLLLGGLTLIAPTVLPGTPRLGGDGGMVQFVPLVLVVSGLAYLATELFTSGLTEAAFESTGSDDSEEALEALKRRYAAGEIEEMEFERRLETLFETETVADAKGRVEQTSVSDDQSPRQDAGPERDDGDPHRSDRHSRRQRRRSGGGHCK